MPPSFFFTQKKGRGEPTKKRKQNFRQHDDVAERGHGWPWFPEQSMDEIDGNCSQRTWARARRSAKPECYQRAGTKSVSIQWFFDH